jgi:hypothetical protein
MFLNLDSVLSLNVDRGKFKLSIRDTAGAGIGYIRCLFLLSLCCHTFFTCNFLLSYNIEEDYKSEAEKNIKLSRQRSAQCVSSRYSLSQRLSESLSLLIYSFFPSFHFCVREDTNQWTVMMRVWR